MLHLTKTLDRTDCTIFFFRPTFYAFFLFNWIPVKFLGPPYYLLQLEGPFGAEDNYECSQGRACGPLALGQGFECRSPIMHMRTMPRSSGQSIITYFWSIWRFIHYNPGLAPYLQCKIDAKVASALGFTLKPEQKKSMQKFVAGNDIFISLPYCLRSSMSWEKSMENLLF